MGRSIMMLCQIFFPLLAFFFLFQVDCSLNFSSSSHHSLPSCLPQQSSVLLQFKNSTQVYDDCDPIFGDYLKTNSWNQSTDCCLWEGVSCHKLTGHVIGINLSQSCLHGTLLENNSLFLLQSLQWLDLSSNDLDGPLLENSSFFRHLHGLQKLSLAYNNFNGSISSRLFTNLVSLNHLNLSYCAFSGLVPHEISLLSNLVSLDLSSGINLRFDSLGFDMLAENLTKLINLALDGVDMSGVTLTSLLNFTSSLEHLSLAGCNLHGEFPSQVFALPYLRYIDLGGNENVTGSLPRTNISLSLKRLDLRACSFRGSIPASFENLTQIMFLDFSDNYFGGQIPNVFGNHNKLTTLKFSNCNFSGQLPSSLFNLTLLTIVDLSDNRLEGTLPNNVDKLQFLEILYLTNNLIGGRVPSWLFTLPSLTRLSLGNNTLTGPIEHFQKPNSLLDMLDLSFNNIHGPIPDSFFELVNLYDIYLQSNNLSGVVKSNKLVKLKSLYFVDFSDNSLLSLGVDGNDFNYSLNVLTFLRFTSCSITQFPSFLQTSNLQLLNLSNNKISAGIAKWEAKGWEYLRVLDLSHNFLTSLEQVPGNPPSLDLRSNFLQGPILSTCLNLPNISNMEFFSISENKLSGNIPDFFCSWQILKVLDLSENNLSGTIPSCLGNNISVTFMNLGMNNLCGEVPDTFNNIYLTNLLLNDNQLEGSIPRSLANCSSLALLNLRNNNLVDTFPAWLDSLSSLQVLILSFNGLHGSMSNSMATYNFSTLRIIDVSHNELTGHLPRKFFQSLRAMKLVPDETDSDTQFSFRVGGRSLTSGLYQTYVIVTWKRVDMKLVTVLTIFYSMDFSSNLFSGQIPKELGELKSVQALNFSNNHLIGPIPSSLGNMVALESLDLSSNKLSGRIPSQLINLTFLEVLDLSRNDLEGPIPTGRQFDTFENNSYRGNLGLCGLPLSKQCSNTPPIHVKHEGSAMKIPFIYKVAMMGYGCGVVLGLSMGYIVFTTGRPWWFVRKVERDWQTSVTNWIRRNRGRRN